jgi:hypothetical protein
MRRAALLAILLGALTGFAAWLLRPDRGPAGAARAPEVPGRPPIPDVSEPDELWNTMERVVDKRTPEKK